MLKTVVPETFLVHTKNLFHTAALAQLMKIARTLSVHDNDSEFGYLVVMVDNTMAGAGVGEYKESQLNTCRLEAFRRLQTVLLKEKPLLKQVATVKLKRNTARGCIKRGRLTVSFSAFIDPRLDEAVSFAYCKFMESHVLESLNHPELNMSMWRTKPLELDTVRLKRYFQIYHRRNSVLERVYTEFATWVNAQL